MGGGKGCKAPDRTAADYDPADEGRVLTPSGFKLIGDVKVGDAVCNPDGTVAKVIAVYHRGEQDFYRVTMVDGASVDVDADHLWTIHVAGLRKRRKKELPPPAPSDMRREDAWNLRVMQRCQTVDTRNLKELVDRAAHDAEEGKRPRNVLIPLTAPVNMTAPKGKWPVMPSYTLGVLLGDGHIADYGVFFFTADPEILSAVEADLDGRLRVSPTVVPESRRDVNGRNYRIASLAGAGRDDSPQALLRRDHLLGTHSWDKFIPKRLLNAPEAERLAVIQGLMDSDGYMDDRGHVEYATVSEQLALDVQYILRSLGCKVSITTKMGSYVDKNGARIECRKVYRLWVRGRHMENLFRLPRKRARALNYLGQADDWPSNRIVSVEPIGRFPSICITVSHPNGLFVTDDFIVTHNSCCFLMDAIRNAVNFPGMRIACFRRTYPELNESFIAELQKRNYAKKLGGRWKQTDYTLTFPNGSLINFTYAESLVDASRIMGGEYQAIYIDEASLMLPEVIQRIEERLRSGKRGLPVIGLRLATNPGGPSNNYLKNRFIKPTNYGKVPVVRVALKDDEFVVVSDGGRRVSYVPSKADDNPFIDKGYKALLDAIPDPQRRAAMRDGDWDAAPGQFFTQFKRDRHCIPTFELPVEWPRYAGIDYGQHAPFACVWCAVDNDGRVYIYRERVIRGLDARSQAKIVLDAETVGFPRGTPDPPVARYADPSMWGHTGTPWTIADMYGMEGCGIAKADNERINGWARMHGFLNEGTICVYHKNHPDWIARGETTCPMLHIFDAECPLFAEACSNLPRDENKPDDAATKNVDDHEMDATRYMLMAIGSGAAPVYNDIGAPPMPGLTSTASPIINAPSAANPLFAGRFAIRR